MKTKLKAILWIAPTRRIAGMSALVALIALALISCSDGGGDSSPKPKPTAQKWTVDLGDSKKVEVNYMAVTAVVPAYLSRLGPVFEDMKAGMPTAVHTINVEYGGTPYDGFVSSGSKTLKVHNNWISSVSDSVCFASLFGVVAEWTA